MSLRNARKRKNTLEEQCEQIIVTIRREMYDKDVGYCLNKPILM